MIAAPRRNNSLICAAIKGRLKFEMTCSTAVTVSALHTSSVRLTLL